LRFCLAFRNILKLQFGDNDKPTWHLCLVALKIAQNEANASEQPSNSSSSPTKLNIISSHLTMASRLARSAFGM
jgi:hypothetical protein